VESPVSYVSDPRVLRPLGVEIGVDFAILLLATLVLGLVIGTH